MSSEKKYNKRPDINEIKEGFEMFNTSKTDRVDPNELKEAMDSLNLKDKVPFVYDLIIDMCHNREIKRKGGLTADEFIDYVETAMKDAESKDGIKRHFDVFCESNNDKIPLTNFCQAARDIGDEETDEELHNMIDEADMGGKELDFEEFKEIMEAEEPEKKGAYRGGKPVTKEKKEPVSYRRVKVEQKPKYGKTNEPKIEIKKEVVIEKYEKPLGQGKNNNEIIVGEINIEEKEIIDKEKPTRITYTRTTKEEVNEEKPTRYYYRNSRGSRVPPKEEDKEERGELKRVPTEGTGNDTSGDGSDSKRYHRRYRDSGRPGQIVTTETITKTTTTYGKK